MLLRPRRRRPSCRAAEQRDELAPSIKKTRSHRTIAKRVGLAKRPKPAKGLPFSSSRVGLQRPVRNSLDHLVGEREQLVRYGEAERLRGLEIYDQQVFCGELDWQVGRLLALKNAVDVARHDPILID